ncbi:lysylphosphatidylglycerol synthase domain-containing protein [Nocardioides sp. GY 10127]|uniref:lysylphosphatidylglycerol synthase domain-containing protein n=1 Tax=Nocardioides sp. GY 10127 TaxID=2569762 RepID=UPI0010A808B5|nr:lysylphosphatidylglycerol synthase domain-containing protein [Nocardioides sp. GY 10127]TIC84212.1 UPF0104 family protein [Nocardioides sp. GY 10127]
MSRSLGPTARWAVRALFLAAVLVCAVVGMRGRLHEVASAVLGVSTGDLLLAGLLVAGGLWLTAGTWLRLLAAYGHRLTTREGSRIFFVGQLGKYLPGSVWSLGAHAELTRPHRVPVRTTVATGLLFLVVNLATAGLLAGALLATGAADLPVPGPLGALGAVGCLLVLSPPVVGALGTRLAHGDDALRLTWVGALLLVARMSGTWLCYAGSVVVLAPEPGWALLGLATAAFAAAYVVGVLVVVAPAGVGARELALVALLAPAVGVGHATAIALVTRVLQTAADFAAAALATLWAAGYPAAASRLSRPRAS